MDGGVAVSATLHRQWDIFMDAGVEELPLPELRHQSPPTYRTIAMDVAWNLTSTMSLTARREASSRRVTTSSLMGLPTLWARLSPPCTCVMTPKSTQVVPCVEGRKNLKGPLRSTIGRLRGISSSETYERRGQTLFTTCMSWILTPSPTILKPSISAWKPLEVKEKESPWCLPQTVSSLHSLCWLNGFPYHGQGGGNTLTYRHPPREKVEETLLTYLQVCEE